MKNRTLQKRILIGLTLTLLAAAGSFLLEYGLKAHGRKNGAWLVVTQGGAEVANLDADTVAKLGDQERSLSGAGAFPEGRKCSLAFVLESAGLENYRTVTAYSAADDETMRLSREAAAGMLLAADADGTVSMLKTGQVLPVMKKVRSLNADE